MVIMYLQNNTSMKLSEHQHEEKAVREIYEPEPQHSVGKISSNMNRLQDVRLSFVVLWLITENILL